MAAGLQAAEVLPFRLDVDVAAHNVAAGLLVLAPYRRGLEAVLPLLAWQDLWGLSELADFQ